MSILYLMLEVVLMICEQNSNQIEIKLILNVKCFQGRWIFFLDLKMEQALFYVKNFLLEIPSISLIIWTISLQKKLCHFFTLKATITHLFIDVTTLEILFSYLVFREDFAKFLFLFTMPEKQKSTMSECLKFTGSI